METYTRTQVEEITRAWFEHEMRKYRRAEWVRRVRIMTAEDSCAACKVLAMRTYELDSVPKLPCRGCTSAIGCRCALAPANE
jgi:hypothetical protein